MTSNEESDPRRERTERETNEPPLDWMRLGRAAEDFARQVARDAAQFAERVEEHARDLARDVGREWRRAEPRERPADAGAAGSEDVRRVFTDVRTLVDDVLGGVDGLLERLFPDRRRAESDKPGGKKDG